MEQISRGEFKSDGRSQPPDEAGYGPLQQALLEREFPDSVINALPCSFFVVTAEGRLLRWNKNLETFSEYSAQEIAALPILDVVVEEQREHATQGMRVAFAQGSYQTEVDCRTKNGHVIPFYVTARRAAMGGRSCLICTGIDITQRRQAEQKLADEHSLLRTLIDNIPDAIYVKDRASRFVLCNTEVLRRKGVGSLEEIAGRSDFDFHPVELAESVYANEQEVMRTGQPLVNIERCVVDPETGRPSWSLTTKVPLRNSTGEIVGLVGIGRDITKRKEAEETYHALVDHSLQGLLIVQDMHILFANRAITEIIGYSVEELRHLTSAGVHALVHTDDQGWVWEQHRTRLRGEYLPERQEFRVMRKDGSVCWLEMHVSRLEYQGRPAIQAACIDITKRRQAEDAVRHSEEQFRGVFENAVLGLYRTTTDGRILMANPSLVHMLGYSSFEEIAGWNLERQGYQPGYSRVDFRERLEAQGQVVGFESAWTKRDGTALFVRQNARAIRDENGKTLYYEGTVEDITAWKQLEKSLHELREIINRSPVLVFLWRVAPGQWPVEFVSENVQHALGYTADDFLSGRVSWPGITHPDDVPRLEAEIAVYLTEGRRDWSQEYRLITQSGEIRWFQDQNLVLVDENGQPARIQSVVLDVTERKRMADALCESERKYRDLYEGSRDGTVAGDLAGRLLHANSVFLDMLGYTSAEINRLTYRDITPARWHAEEYRRVHEQVLARGYSDVFEKEYVRKDGTLVPVEIRIYLSRDNEGDPIGTWVLVRDITERKKAEAQVQQHLAELTRAWHANTLGEMATGLAHELNQPLCAILNYSNGCLRLTRKEQFALETLRGPIEQIAAQAQRAADIIKHIRGLTAGREPQRIALNLEAILRDAVRMLQDEAAKHKVAIGLKVAHNLPAVHGDTVEIEQVVLNLMRNAIEAMSEARVSDRALTIAVAPTTGGLVEVAVADTGRGVAPELAEKIFESFFTTKREGLGIGLALSRRIVEAHGGRLWVESDGRSGATFRFTLPVEGAVHGDGKSDRVCGG